MLSVSCLCLCTVGRYCVYPVLSCPVLSCGLHAPAPFLSASFCIYVFLYFCIFFSVFFFLFCSNQHQARTHTSCLRYCVSRLILHSTPAGLTRWIGSVDRPSTGVAENCLVPGPFRGPISDLHLHCLTRSSQQPLTHISLVATLDYRPTDRTVLTDRILKLVAAALVPARPSAAPLPIKA
ncbi:hypothetical protein F5Y10DRAFT_180272 [Nemania abortiva]|nr:hypothetical protein F5Y10DRAFT_180272 [Nemania abortiva]